MIEYEKKILLTKDEYKKLITTFSENAKTIVQKNHYYDTRDYKLNKNGVTCRIREKDNKFIQYRTAAPFSIAAKRNIQILTKPS